MAFEIQTLEQAGQLAAMLGVPLFKTDLYIPRYKEGRFGRWKISRARFHLEGGYHSGTWAVWDMPVLLRCADGEPESWETWMSLSPHEIESQGLACPYARGYTVVMGLGLGWIAINFALNPNVTRVTVVERDSEVISLLATAEALNDLPEKSRKKLHIVQADALEWTPAGPVDFLYADIWRGLNEPQALGDVRRMQENVRAEKIYFWGQELAILAGVQNLGQTGSAGDTGAQLVRRAVEEVIALPLLIPDNLDYAALVEKVARQRRTRRGRP